MSLQINLSKPGDTANRPKLSLNLSKGDKFSVELSWNDDHDLDAHAIMLTQGKVSVLERVLSTYNRKRDGVAEAALMTNPNGSFNTPEGALLHSGDALTGTNADVDEVITVDPSRIPADVDEIGVFITIHPNGTVKFGQVKSPDIVVKKNDQQVQDYHLADQFGEFNGIQAVSFVRGQNGWEVSPVGVGFVDSFNGILAQLS